VGWALHVMRVPSEAGTLVEVIRAIGIHARLARAGVAKKALDHAVFTSADCHLAHAVQTLLGVVVVVLHTLLDPLLVVDVLTPAIPQLILKILASVISPERKIRRVLACGGGRRGGSHDRVHALWGICGWALHVIRAP